MKNLKGKTIESKKFSGIVKREDSDGVFIDVSIGDDEQFSEEYVSFDDIETIDGEKVERKNYKVKVYRPYFTVITVGVEASSEEEAKEKAEELSGDIEGSMQLDADNIECEIIN